MYISEPEYLAQGRASLTALTVFTFLKRKGVKVIPFKDNVDGQGGRPFPVKSQSPAPPQRFATSAACDPETCDPAIHDPKTCDPAIHDPKTCDPKEARVRKAEGREAGVRKAKGREAGVRKASGREATARGGNRWEKIIPRSQK